MNNKVLFIGGPWDGEKKVVELLPVLNVYEQNVCITNTMLRNDYIGDISQPTIYSYIGHKIGNRVVYGIDTMTYDQVIDRLLRRYRKTYKRKKSKHKFPFPISYTPSFT